MRYAEGLPDEANLGLLILGESVGPASPGDPGNPQDPEPLFMFEPLNADELPQNITINTSESPMKRVVFESYDESGDLLTEPHYNAIYSDTGNGILAGLILDGQDSGERVLWLPYGSYEYQTFINASIDEDSKLYFMTTTLEINDESPDTQVKTLGGEDLVALECFVEDWDVPYMVAVTLHKDENGMSPVFYRNFWHDPDIPQVILVTPGIYDVQGVLAYNNHTESWCLWIDKALTLEKSADTEDILVWDYDGSYSMQFDMNNPSPGISDTVTFSVDITDNKGSRVIGACANVDIGVGIGSLAEDDDIYAQDHYKIAPFIHIKNPQGEEVFRYKDDGSSYDLLMMWNMWDAEYVGTLRPIGRESTFFGAEYTVPEGLHGGEYTAVAELDLTFLGELRKEIKFNIDAGLTAPVLNQQEPLVTNAGSFTVSGTASPNATVKFSYTLNNGEKTEAGTVQAGANGSFAANITLPSEGTYIITAVVTENGLTSGESNEITVTVDRTPPGKPVNLTGDSPGQSVVNLTWGAPSGEEPGDIRYEIYRIYYDEDGVQQETIIAENLQFSQTPYTYQDTNLNADTEYTYRIYAIDIAGNRSNAANITVRTSKEPDMVPPTKPANLRAGYDGSTSSVDITWNASTDNVGVNGYKVYRRLDNSNDWVHIGTVASSSALTYNDDSLYAETKYWYSVSAYDEAGNESEKSEPVAVTTPPLNLDNATLRVKKDRNGLTAVGNEISFTVYGAKNRTAYIEFKLDCWETGPDGNLPESPVEKTETIQLEESKDSFGNVLGIYQGKYTIPENTAAVKSAKAFISDEAEPAPHLTSTDMAGLPVYVSGTLTVTISETSPEAFNAIRSGKLSIWSNSEKSGDYKTVDNPGTYTFNGLVPGSDYLLKLTGLYDQVAFVLENIEVQRGRNTTVTIDLPETVNLYIRVVDETGNPVQDALVTVIDPDTGFTIVSCLSNEDGWAAVGSNTSGKQPVLENRFFMDKVSIKTSLPSQDLKLKFDPEAVVKSNLIPGNNEIEIELDKRPMGVLEGVITGFNGNPLRDASLRIIQIVAGEYVTRSIKTDEDGRYSIELNTGSTGVSISHWRVANNSSFFYNVLIRDDETTTLDVTLKPDAYIKINAYTQLAGELEYPIVMDSWRVSSSFKITIRRTDNPNQYVNYRMAADGLNCTFIIQDANPGDQFEVTLEDKNVGLGSETVTVELNEDGFAIAEIHLIEKGLLKADVRDQQGLKRTGFSRKVWIYDGNNPDSSLVTSITSGSNDISVNLEEGEYTAVFSWGAGQQIIASGYMPDESYMLTLGALEDHLSSMQSLEYVKVENIGVTFNQITDLSRIGVPYISYTSGSAFSNEESWLISNKTTAGPNSVITLQARYQLSDEFDMSRGLFNPKLRLGIPNGTTLIEESIVIETENDYQPDVVISSLSAEYFEISLADFSGGGNLCSNSGTITYQVRVKRQPEWPLTVASASMSYESRNISGLFSTVNEMLGEVHIEIPYISISAPEVVTSPIVNIKGYAPPDTDIRIYDGSCLLAETRVSRYGTWMQEVELADKGDPSDHWLYAKLADEEGNELAYGQTMVTYDSMYPVINRITMGQYSQYANDGHVVSYNPSEGIATFPYVYAPSMKTYFIIEFSNANRVKPGSVVVRSGNGFSLEAEYREDTRDYYASEKITGQMGTNYMPGPISVEYEVKPTEWSIPSEIPGEDDIRKSLPDSLKDADVSVDDPGVYEPGPDGVYRSPTVTVRSSGMSGTDFELQGWITLKFLENYPPAQIPGANPAIAIGSNSSGGSMDVHNYHCSITRQGNDGLISCGYTAPIEAFDDTPVSEMSMQALPSLPSIYKGVEVGFDIIDKGNTFVEAATNILNGPGMFDELEGLLDYVDKNCTGYAPELYYNLINMEAEGMMKDFAISSSLQLVSFGISATGFGAAVGIPTFLAGSLMGYIMNKNREDSVQELKETIMDDERCKDEEEEDDDDDNDSRDKKDKQKVSDHDYILDPSGYVYEAVPENRIEGVRATLFEYNVDQEIWEVWDSRYYGQDNPLFTDGQGRYAWDVPEGDWRVMYEKDGYVTTNSWEMHVPPPHTDVNIGLVSFAAPSVSSVTAAGGGEYIEITFNKYMKPDTIGDSTLQVQKDGEVDDDNDPVFTVGDIVPVNPQPSPGSPDPNDTLARIFRFVPETPLEVNGRYDVRISGVVQSYAGSIMGEDFTVSLTVPENAIPVTSVTLNRSSLTLYPGESSRLTATVLPANATVRTVFWQSSKPNVANVDDTGLVTANATGTSVITVTTTDGGYTSTCTVNVIPIPADDDDDDDSDYYYQYVPVTGITLDKTELSLIVRGEPVVLNSTVLPPNATNKNIVWSSSNQKVAVVQNGRVTPVGAGTAIITAKTSAGGYSATCTVTVKPAAVDVFSGKVGANSAVIEAFDGDISLVFETASFLSDTGVTIERFDSDGVPDGYIGGSSVFDISFGGNEPRKSVILMTRYDQKAAEETNPLKFVLYKWDEDSSAWVYAGGAVSTESGVVVAEIEAPGRYMLMAYDRTFSDISSHWSRDEVEVLASRRVIAGYANNEFRPENQITRGEFIKLVMSMVPYCPYVEAARSQTTGTYDDVTSDKWYFPYVEAATELGIVTGSGGSFRPEDPISREEMAVILIRIFNTPAEMEQAARECPVLFNDSDDISGWALGAVILANQKGIIKGDASGNFRPKDYAKRAEAAAVILRTMENLGFIKAPESLKGTLRVVEIEGTHFELEVPCTCPSGKTYYVIIPADCIIEKQLGLFINKEVQITGILQDEPNIYMRGPVLKAISIGDRIRTACAKCSQ